MERDILQLPIEGVSDVFAFTDFAGLAMVPPDNMLNIMPYGTSRQLRLGKRPGLGPHFKTEGGGWWQAPSYIQAMGQVNIAAQTRLDPGGLATAILNDETGGGDPVTGVTPDRDTTLIDNLNYAGNGTTPPPLLDANSYTDFFGQDTAVVGGETPSSLTCPVSRWDMYTTNNDVGIHADKELLIMAWNYYVTAAGPGTTVRRTRIVSMRKRLSDGKWIYVSEFELSDGPDSGRTLEPTNGTINFAISGDPDKPWHISTNDIDVGPDYVYVALNAVQTSDNTITGTITKRRGWMVAIPKFEFVETGGLHTYSVTKQRIDGWAQECTGVRYRPAFPIIRSNATIQPVPAQMRLNTLFNDVATGSLSNHLGLQLSILGGEVYGDIPDVLVCFQGYRDFQSGIARYDDTGLIRLRFGEVPSWKNAGHGVLKGSYEGQTGGQLTEAGPAALIDGDHGYCRFAVVTKKQRSLQLDTTNNMNKRWTHGCYPVAMDVNTETGEVYIARTAVGIGVPNRSGNGYATATYSTANLPGETVSRVTVMALNGAGELRWEANTNPFIPTNPFSIGTSPVYGPFYNDRFRPTLKAIAADRNGGCLVVGHMANGKNVWHVQNATSAGEGNVNWSASIGINVTTNVEDSSGNETRTLENETVGIAQLTMYNCAFDPRTNQFAVVGESFPTSTIVSAATYSGGNPAVGEWQIKNTVTNAATLYSTWGKGSVWKLNGNSGFRLWRRLIGNSTTEALSVAMKAPDESNLSGSYIAVTHEELTGTTAATNAGWQWEDDLKYWWLRNESPPTRQCLVFDRILGNNEEFVIQVRKRIHEIKACVKGSPDMKDCYEVGTHYDTTFAMWKLVIRKVKDSVPETFLNDIPLADLNLTSDDTAFEIRVRVVGGLEIQAFLSTQPDQDTPAITATVDEFYEHDRIGVAANFQTTSTGAENQGSYVDPTAQIVRVTKADIYTLIPNQITAAQVFCTVSDGQLFASWDGEVIEHVPGLNMRTYGLVGLTQFHSKLYLVDGEHAMVFDPTLAPGDRINKWTPTEGSLPGATEDGLGGFEAGTTNAKIIITHLDRVGLAGMEDDSNNIKFCAQGDANDWNEDSEVEFGRATSLSNELAGVTGVPITSLHPYEDDFLLLGHRNQLNVVYGDIQTENARYFNLTREAGIYNVNALTYGDKGQALLTTEQGLAHVAGDTIDIFSKQRLHKFAVPETHEGTVHTTAIRDGNRYGTFFGFTRVAAEESSPEDVYYYYSTSLSNSTVLTSKHLWFDERKGGFYVLEFDPGADPICVSKYGDVVLFGGRDGLIRKMVDGRANDIGGEGGGNQAFTWYFPASVITMPSARDAVKLTELFIMTSEDSTNATVGYKRGDSAEAVFERTYSDNDATRTIGAGDSLLRDRIRGRCVLVTFFGSGANDLFELERVEKKVSAVRISRVALVDSGLTLPDAYNLDTCPTTAASPGAFITDLVASMSLGTHTYGVFISGDGGGGLGGQDPVVGGLIVLANAVSMTVTTPAAGVLLGSGLSITPSAATISVASSGDGGSEI